MINIFFNLIKANLVLEVQKLTLKLIFFLLVNRFAILLSIVFLPISIPIFVSNLFLLGLNQLEWPKIEEIIIFNIKMLKKTAILLKLLKNHL